MMKIEDYFRLMAERKASDLHLSSGTTPKLRVGGEIVDINEGVLTAEDVRALIDPILPQRNREFPNNGEAPL